MVPAVVATADREMSPDVIVMSAGSVDRDHSLHDDQIHHQPRLSRNLSPDERLLTPTHFNPRLSNAIDVTSLEDPSLVITHLLGLEAAALLVGSSRHLRETTCSSNRLVLRDDHQSIQVTVDSTQRAVLLRTTTMVA